MYAKLSEALSYAVHHHVLYTIKSLLALTQQHDYQVNHLFAQNL